MWAKNVLDEGAIRDIYAADTFNSRQFHGIDAGYNRLKTTLPREIGITWYNSAVCVRQRIAASQIGILVKRFRGSLGPNISYKI